MSYIYLASPYTDPDPSVMERRYMVARRELGLLLRRGEHVYSPIVHCHHIAEDCELPRGWDFWWDFNKAMLAPARELRVLKLKGWRESVGVREEINFAYTKGKPVAFVDLGGYSEEALSKLD